MNQAILRSEIDNGPKEYWNFSDANFFDKYFAPYLQEVSVKKFQSFGGQNMAVYFSDGSVLVGKQVYDYFYFPNAKILMQKVLRLQAKQVLLWEEKIAV